MPSKLVDLRNLLTERFPHARAAPKNMLTTGFASLDQAARGGLPLNAITEIISPQTSAGSASLIHLLIQSARHDAYFVALIDGCDSFDPTIAVSTNALLWVRCQKAFEAIKAADLLLRDGNFRLVIVDLALNPAEELRKIPQTSWYRLQRLAESNAVACVIVTRHSIVSSAQLKIVLENTWSLRSLENQNTTAQLRFRVQRSHVVGGRRAVGAD
jgi:RecA/RadA recombinase